MVKSNYLADIENEIKNGKKPVELLNIILRFLNFKPVEIRIFNLLLKSSFTIKQIENRLNISERTIRKYIKRLDDEGFIIRTVEQGNRLKYIYKSVTIQEAWDKIKDKIERILDNITKIIDLKTMSYP